MKLSIANVLGRIPHDVYVGSIRDCCTETCLHCTIDKLLEAKTIETKEPREAFESWMNKINAGWNGTGQPHEKLTERLIETLWTGFEAGFRYSTLRDERI